MIRKHAPPIIILLAVSVLFTYGHRSWDVPAYPGSAQLDAPKMFVPLRFWTFKHVAAGTLPLWNPMILCGTPNVAEIQSAIFYPPNLIFAVLNTAEAYSASVALHLFLAGATGYLLMIYYGCSPPAGIVTGITYMLCGPQVTHLWAGHLTILCVVAWAPLLLLLYDRAVTKMCLSSAALGGVVLSLQLLAGYPQCALYAIHTASFLGLCRTVSLFVKEGNRRSLAIRFGIQAVVFSIGFGLAAIQLFPAAEFVPHSVRSQTSYEWPGTHSLPPENLFSYLAPEFFAYWGREPYLWETCAYVGIAPLFLVMVAVFQRGFFRKAKEGFQFGRLEIRIFSGVFVLSVLLALSRFTPLYHVAYKIVPGFSLFRGHAKYLLNAALALSVLAGFGLDAYAALGQQARKNLLRYSSALTALLLLPPLTGAINASLETFWLSQLTYLVAHLSPGILSPERPATLAFNGVTAAGVVLLVFCLWQAFCVYWPEKERRPGNETAEKFLRGPAVRVVLVLLLLDVGHVSWKYFSLTPLVFEGEPSLEIAASDRLSTRLLNEKETPAFSLHKVNASMLTDVPSPEGYVGNAIGAYSEFFRWAENEPPKKVDFTYERNSMPNSMSSFFSERRSRSSLPRAFFLADARTPSELPPQLPTSGDAGEFYPRTLSRMPVPFGDFTGIEFKRTALISRYEPNSAEVLIDRPRKGSETDGSGYLVITDSFYPGWTAYVDGRKEECLRMYVTFRGVYTGPDAGSALFVYSPFSIRFGMFASMSVLACTVALLGFKACRDRLAH